MTRHFKISRRKIMSGTVSPKRLLFGASTQINIEDFYDTDDYVGTTPSSRCTTAESPTIIMSTIGGESLTAETKTMIPLNLTCARPCESQSSLNFFVSPMTLPTSDHQTVSPLAFQPSMMKVSHRLLPHTRAVLYPMKTQSQATMQHRINYQNVEKIKKNSNKRKRGIYPRIVSFSSLICSRTYCNDSIDDSKTPLSPITLTSIPWDTASPELPPVLNLLKHRVELAFPDCISCAISTR